MNEDNLSYHTYFLLTMGVVATRPAGMAALGGAKALPVAARVSATTMEVNFMVRIVLGWVM